MQKPAIWTLFFVLTFFAGFFVKAAMETAQIAAFFTENITEIAGWALSFLGAFGAALLIGYLILKRFLQRKLGAASLSDPQQMVTEVVDQLSNPNEISNPSSQDRQKGALISLALFFIRRSSLQFYAWLLVTVVGGTIGAATIILLNEQNLKLDTQNERILEQNEQIVLQTQANIAASILLEGSRRAALSGGMDALFEEIRNEPLNIEKECNGVVEESCFRRVNVVDQWDEASEAKVYYMSGALINKVTSFATTSTPYPVAISNGQPLDMSVALEQQFSFPELSPERGLLLQNLVRNQISVPSVDFSKSLLIGADLRNASLTYANFTASDFRQADLFRANLSLANMAFANLSQVQLSTATLSSTDLTSANLTGAILGEADFRAVNLKNANLSGAYVEEAMFSNDDRSEEEKARDQQTYDEFVKENGYVPEPILTEANLEGTWAWKDMPPYGKDDLLDRIMLCRFDPIRHKRDLPPDVCETE
ncbi:pentapeptide repeat-containing protein [Sedimentitalea todarodis]|uniref:Pentapeptide repeat-containing protein n=1 Tax=Sedimentitalea todarodis TaxID=1631240 RepID=A0ABU3VL21_9RHOB|nr:pentapeptide repeat-containing protein [Sedimentitalea todarodis]MDU9006882.1 pentapeptide repeat-containing protein [Sedimentitalea todarodis]